MTTTVEQIYTKKFINRVLDKVGKNFSMSEFQKTAYELCKPHLGNMSEKNFAAKLGNHNPNRCRMGEDSQVELLAKEFSDIERTIGKRSIQLIEMDDGSKCFVFAEEGNIDGIKSIDAMASDDTYIYLFYLKSVDIGPASTSEWGGHQKNVQNEVVCFAKHASEAEMKFEGKKVRVCIGVNGRTADRVIRAARKASRRSSNIIIGTCEHILETVRASKKN